MNWRGKRVLVTGADGFIGSHLAERLASTGARVTALAQYNSFDRFGWLDDLPPETLAQIERLRGDIRDADQMRALCAGQDIVFHLAALIAIPFSYEAPSSYVATNVSGTLNLLAAARDAKVARIVHTSTSEVYGTALRTPIAEDHPLQGQSPYSASKIGADMMAEAFHRSFGLPVVTLRPFNTFGPRQSERAVISAIIRQSLDPACEEIRLGDLTPKRDFNFVADTVDAFLAVADLDLPLEGQVFNAGSGRMVSIAETARLILQATDCRKPIREEATRRRPAGSEVMALQADARRLTQATGWSPAVGLEEGIARTVEWWRAHLAFARKNAAYVV